MVHEVYEVDVITNPQLQALVVEYSTSYQSLRKIAKNIGRSEYWLRCSLHRYLGSTRYRELVLNVLFKRIARTRGKRLKHAIWVLRRVKPHEYAKAQQASKPKRCASCARPIQARLSAGMWIWNCDWCGNGGIERCLVL